ncbi:hypothetical protein Emag_005873 [Eimeria magna]
MTEFCDCTVIPSGYAGPPSPSQLSNEAYEAECRKKIAAGKYPSNFDCSQRLHTEAGMADSILELSEATPAARDPIFDITAKLVKSEFPETDEGCSDSDDLSTWGISEDDNPDLANLCKSGSPFCNPRSCLKHVLVLSEEDVSVDGSKCDRPGVSLEQWGRDGFCDYKAASCFAKNLKWFYDYNQSAVNASRTPQYAVMLAQTQTAASH